MTTSRAGRRPVPSRDVVASATGAAIYSLSLGIASVALPLLALRADYSAAEIGALTALSAVSQMVTRMFLGPAMRRWPDWTLIAAAAVLLAASCGLVVLSTAVVPFLLSQLLQGMSRACFWTGSQTHVVRGADRAAGALATMNLVSGIGLLAGPVAAGILSELSPTLALGVATAVALVGLVPIFMLDRLPPFAPPADRPSGRIWRRPGVDIGCWAGVTAGGWRGLLSSYVPVALDDARQSASTIGALVAVANGASLVGAALAARVPRRWSARTVLGGIVVTGLATSLTAALAWSAPLTAVVLLVSGIAAGAIQVLGQATAAESVHREERGDAIATTGTFRAAALFIAPLGVAGLVLVIPLAPAVALAGAAIAAPAIGLRHHLDHRKAS